MARLRGFYKENVFPAMKDKFSYGNPMKVPRVVKIVVNMGLGEGSRNSSILEAATKDLATITGQKPKITKARISVANFKLRAGMDVGSKVTLRGNQMWEFMDRLVNVALPRVRDFRGVSEKGFDGRGNYNLGIKEQIIFPEIDYDKVDKVRGLDITITTNAGTDDEARALLAAFNFPFRK